MDTVVSFLISAVIIAFGVWVFAVTIAAGLPLAWPLMGMLAVIVGLISLYGSIRDANTFSGIQFLRRWDKLSYLPAACVSGKRPRIANATVTESSWLLSIAISSRSNPVSVQQLLPCSFVETAN